MELENPNLLVRLQNKVKTRVVLNQTEGIFSDFNRKDFDKTAVAIYEAARDASVYNDKVTLMNVLSYPLHDLIAGTMHIKLQMPFRFYSHILGVDIRHGRQSSPARIFSHDLHNMNNFVTWHQIATRFRVELEGKPRDQLVVFERRESDTEHFSWKLCHLSL